jgi:hypothetical protein
MNTYNIENVPISLICSRRISIKRMVINNVMMTGLVPPIVQVSIFTIFKVRSIVSGIPVKWFHANTACTMKDTGYKVKFW